MSSSNNTSINDPSTSAPMAHRKNSAIEEDELALPKMVVSNLGESSMSSNIPDRLSSPTMTPPTAPNSSPQTIFDNSQLTTPLNLSSPAGAPQTTPFERFQTSAGVNFTASASLNSMSSSSMGSRHAVHTNWEAIFVHTARCDSCDKNKQVVLQRCVDCNHQLCQPCMMGKKWKKFHDADFALLVWSPSPDVKKSKKSRGQSGLGSIKKTSTPTPSLAIGAGTKSAAGSSRVNKSVNKSVYNKEFRLSGQRLMTEEEKFMPSYSNKGPSSHNTDHHRPSHGSPLANEVSYDRYHGGSPLAKKHPAFATMPLPSVITDNSDLFDDSEEDTAKVSKQPVKSGRKLRKTRESSTPKVNQTVPTPTRRQPPRRTSASGEPVPAPNYREDEDDEMGLSPNPGDEDIEMDRMSATQSGGLFRGGGMENYKGASLDKFGPVQRPSVDHAIFQANESSNLVPLREIGYQHPYTSNDRTAQGFGGRVLNQQVALPDRPMSPFSKAPPAKPSYGGAALPVEKQASFSDLLAQLVREKAEKKKEAERAAKAAALAALELECAQHWSTDAHLIQLRRDGNEDEARELLDSVKAMIALQRGILLNEDQKEKK